MLLPVGPGVAEGLRAVLKSFHDAIGALQAPDQPQAVFALTQAQLPPPQAWPNTVVLVRDLNILAHSDGVHWIRQDTGAVIV